jgi:hypothetical protein
MALNAAVPYHTLGGSAAVETELPPARMSSLPHRHHRTRKSNLSASSCLREQLHEESVRDLQSTSSMISLGQAPWLCRCCFLGDDACRCCERRRKMPPLHALVLTPYEKAYFYGVIPFRAILHVLLCLTATFLVSTYHSGDGLYYRRVNEALCTQVMPEGTDCRYGTDVMNDNVIGTLVYFQADFFATYSGAIRGFLAHESQHDGVDIFYKGKDLAVDISWTAITSESFRLTNSDETASLQFFEIETETKRYANVSDLSEGPFSNSKTTPQNDILRTRKIQLSGTFRNYRFDENDASCYVWRMTMVWDFRSRAAMKLSMGTDVVGRCNPGASRPFGRRQSLNLSVFLLSLGVLVLNIRSIVKRVVLISSLRIVVNESDGMPKVVPRELGDHGFGCLSCRQCLRTVGKHGFTFVPMHFWSLLLGNVFICWTTVEDNGDSNLPTEAFATFVWALGLLLTWWEARRYLNFRGSSDTFLLFAVLEKAGPRVVRFMFSCLPAILAYTVAGVVLFSSRLRMFQDVGTSFATLFCIANGDSMMNIFEAAWFARGWLGYLYLFTWSSIVIFVIVNVFLVIVQQTYEELQGSDHGMAAEAAPKGRTAAAASSSSSLSSEAAGAATVYPTAQGADEDAGGEKKTEPTVSVASGGAGDSAWVGEFRTRSVRERTFSSRLDPVSARAVSSTLDVGGLSNGRRRRFTESEQDLMALLAGVE